MLPGIPIMGQDIPPERALESVDVAIKKKMADVALNAARSKGREIHRAIDERVLTQRIERALRVELSVVARPWRILEVRHRSHRRRF